MVHDHTHLVIYGLPLTSLDNTPHLCTDTHTHPALLSTDAFSPGSFVELRPPSAHWRISGACASRTARADIRVSSCSQAVRAWVLFALDQRRKHSSALSFSHTTRHVSAHACYSGRSLERCRTSFCSRPCPSSPCPSLTTHRLSSRPLLTTHR